MGLYPTTFPRKTKSDVDFPTYLDRQTKEANLSGQEGYLVGWLGLQVHPQQQVVEARAVA